MMTALRWQLVGVWLVTALVLGGALLAATRDRHPLDDPDLALERPGFLDARSPPTPAPAVAAGIPAPGMRAVVFFTRPEQFAPLSRALLAQPSLAVLAAAVVVIAGDVPPEVALSVPVVADPDGRLAAAFMIDRPRDGGPPVGYAIVDSHGWVRYRTLDPGVTDRLDEVETMVRATP